MRMRCDEMRMMRSGFFLGSACLFGIQFDCNLPAQKEGQKVHFPRLFSDPLEGFIDLLSLLNPDRSRLALLKIWLFLQQMMCYRCGEGREKI